MHELPTDREKIYYFNGKVGDRNAYLVVRSALTFVSASYTENRVYSQVNVNRPASYWDYDNISVDWG